MSSSIDKPASAGTRREFPILIVRDTNVCWLFPDGSHRGVTQADVDQVNGLIDYANSMQMGIIINGQ